MARMPDDPHQSSSATTSGLVGRVGHQVRRVGEVAPQEAQDVAVGAAVGVGGAVAAVGGAQVGEGGRWCHPGVGQVEVLEGTGRSGSGGSTPNRPARAAASRPVWTSVAARLLPPQPCHDRVRGCSAGDG